MKIAVEGCAHGELEKIYETIAFIEEQEKYKVDLLICCGDFQSTRNLNDLQCMAVSQKHQGICTFYKYYSGEKTAPILTIFIGGNHEASNYLQELGYGGWVAPNIYYLGYAGVININGIRIGGISGIFKGNDFLRGRHEFSPYTENTKRSVYHTRQLDVFRLKQLSGQIDILLSHDWPRGIYNFGNKKQLLKFKPFFQEDIDRGQLGSPPCEDLLNHLQPTYWFSAHLHCKFSALVPHEETKKTTKFLALDKCLPKRRFLQVFDFETTENGNMELQYDIEWCTILHLTNHLISVKNVPYYMPGKGCNERFEFTPTAEEKSAILEKFNRNLKIPLNFTKTAEAYNPLLGKTYPQQPQSEINPQTSLFCETLKIDDPLVLAILMTGQELNYSNYVDDSINDSSLTICDTSSKDNDSDMNNSIGSVASRISFSALSLPTPKNITNSEEVELSDDDTDDLDLEVANKESSVSEDTLFIDDRGDISPVPVIFDESELTSTPIVKKFKRRNETIYSEQID